MKTIFGTAIFALLASYTSALPGADCSLDETVCDKLECCGESFYYNSDGSKSAVLKICNNRHMAQFVDLNDKGRELIFYCKDLEIDKSAVSIAASITALAATFLTVSMI